MSMRYVRTILLYLQLMDSKGSHNKFSLFWKDFFCGELMPVAV